MLLTSVDVLTKYWPFGRETLFLCRVAKAGPCFAVYYSSFAVVAIAVDRHRCIVHSDSKQVGLLNPIKQYTGWSICSVVLTEIWDVPLSS